MIMTIIVHFSWADDADSTLWRLIYEQFKIEKKKA